MRRAYVSAALLMVLGGCSGSEFMQRYGNVAHGIGTSPSSVLVEQRTEGEEKYLAAYAKAAGLQSLPSGVAEDWLQVTLAAVNDIDSECDKYLEMLTNLNKMKKAVQSEVSLLGATTAAIEGVTGASAKSIAITGSAFGLIGGSIDNGVAPLLYQLEPSAVTSLVNKMRQEARTSIISSKINTRVESVAGIRRYLKSCLPAEIERSVNDAVLKAADKIPAGTEQSGAATPSTDSSSSVSPSATPRAVSPPAAGTPTPSTGAPSTEDHKIFLVPQQIKID